jgi:hypothetical protein
LSADETNGSISMTIRELGPYRARLTDAIKRIVHSIGVIGRIFSSAKAINGPIVDGHPQVVRDIEFVAQEVEALADTVARKAVPDDATPRT